ncbi:MAG TPA: DUF3105 domain-containing protein [Acidimicrobiales bacterium]|nr:DUF3105 domain-containing protein [Acidimicrobiales bacterium]
MQKKPTKSTPKRKPAGNRPQARRTAPAAQRSRREREARALRRRIVVSGVLLVLAGIVVFFAAKPDRGPSVSDQLQAGAGSCLLDSNFDGDKAAQFRHIPNPRYEVDPPAGGAHTDAAANPGNYRTKEAPSDGELVHAMQHGFVILWVKPGLSDAEQGEVDGLSNQFGRELIVVERPSLEGDVAVTAWHKRLLCRRLERAKVATFTNAFKDRGPEKGFL